MRRKVRMFTGSGIRIRIRIRIRDQGSGSGIRDSSSRRARSHAHVNTQGSTHRGQHTGVNTQGPDLSEGAGPLDSGPPAAIAAADRTGGQYHVTINQKRSLQEAECNRALLRNRSHEARIRWPI
ncbi:hypothetical protein EYF80_025349 [Liparis tanakae]|uniref:Uncharacterized protein n=1 Tax=Liparis tanakae TaxID=230148 RepID=A0A4Z2HEY8_9TELE|nr:hypothetical protein EYF80_025349 [Liparis tanakae]